MITNTNAVVMWFWQQQMCHLAYARAWAAIYGVQTIHVQTIHVQAAHLPHVLRN